MAHLAWLTWHGSALTAPGTAVDRRSTRRSEDAVSLCSSQLQRADPNQRHCQFAVQSLSLLPFGQAQECTEPSHTNPISFILSTIIQPLWPLHTPAVTAPHPDPALGSCTLCVGVPVLKHPNHTFLISPLLPLASSPKF